MYDHTCNATDTSQWQQMSISMFTDQCCLAKVAHWLRLIEMGFYDGGSFYRAEEGYLLQGGAQYVWHTKQAHRYACNTSMTEPLHDGASW
jgi:cyclophilin family peptidyl-prolyl cis-trans isomerase